MSPIYLDHNATSPLRPEVLEAFSDALRADLGNASSVHTAGRRARQKLDEARERVAAALKVHEDEIIFTSGGTEADNLAILGSFAACNPEASVVTTGIEHAAVLGACEELERRGHLIHRVPVDNCGQPDLEQVIELAASPETRLVSVMAVNNEVGSKPNLQALGADLRQLGARSQLIFHTDAVQALGRVPVELKEWGVDLASFSAHKLGGPLGAGVLFRRKGQPLHSLVFGGDHEGGKRPGTENVPASCAAAVAIELAVLEQPLQESRWKELGLLFWSQVRSLFPRARLLGPDLHGNERSFNTLNILLPDVDGRVLVTRLDLAGLQVSAGSACASGSLEPSHVLLAMGLNSEEARSGLRVSFGATTNEQDIHSALQILSSTLGVAR